VNARRPAPVLPAIPVRSGTDARVLRGAALVAVGLHAAVLLVPLRIARPAPPVEPPAADPPRVHVWKPRLPETRVPEVAPRIETVRRIPIPAREPERLAEPVAEAVLAPAVEPIPGFDAVPVPEGAPPTAAPTIADEGDAGVESPVRVGGGAEPAYPPLAVRAGVGGDVVLQATIDPTGRVVDVRVRSAPRPDLGFTEAAIAAVRTWRYRPGTWRGQPIAVRMTVRVTFRLTR